MPVDVKALAQRFNDEVFNKGNVSFVDEVCAPNFRAMDALGGTFDREGLKQLARGYRAAFPDLQIRTEEVIAEGDAVVVRWRGTGTHRGELMGIPPTGKELKVTGLDLFRFSGGKAVEHISQWDVYGMFKQLGMPIPGIQPPMVTPEVRPEARR